MFLFCDMFKKNQQQGGINIKKISGYDSLLLFLYFEKIYKLNYNLELKFVVS